MSIKPTKIAFDPCPVTNDHPQSSALNDIKRSLTITLTAHLRQADLMRSLDMTGNHAMTIEIAGGNELNAQLYVQLIERFETLMGDGFGFSAALYQLLAEGWLNRLDDFESLGQGNG